MKLSPDIVVIGFLSGLLLLGVPSRAEEQDTSDVNAPGIAQSGDSLSSDSAILVITSSPDSAVVMVNSEAGDDRTPLTVSLYPGTYRIEAAREGYEPLTHEMSLMAGQRLSAEFLLKSSPPPPIPPESLGLTYLPEQPLLDTHEAENLRQSFYRMAEIFAIIPMGQGILAWIVVDSENRAQANVLIISGAVLSGGSLLLGKTLSNRKRHRIEAMNNMITQDNMVNRERNAEIDRQLKDRHGEALQRWQLENSNRGRVIVRSSQP